MSEIHDTMNLTAAELRAEYSKALAMVHELATARAAEATQHQQEIAAKDETIRQLEMEVGLWNQWGQQNPQTLQASKLEARLAAVEAERDRLKAALEAYMAQFGQALDAHYIPYDDFQRAADAQARAALSGEGTAKPMPLPSPPTPGENR